MIRTVASKGVWAAACLFPVVLSAFSTGPPVKRTGATVDGGINCTVCHATFAPANSDARGSVLIKTAAYTPGVKQTIQVTISHPEQKRWGFQLIARLASDPAQQAGTFTVADLIRVRCGKGGDAPCNGDQEFAEHKLAQVTDLGAGFTYSVEWTPPATNVGDVLFYAAGNAANGDGTLNGDRIYTTSAVVTPAICDLASTPSITGVTDAAMYQSAISPNSMVSIFGAGMGRDGVSRGIFAADMANHAFPAALSCVAVEIDGKRAPLTWVQGTQINAQAPSVLSGTRVGVRVLLNPDTPKQIASTVFTVAANAASPAFFTFNGKSVAAQFANTVNVVANPAVVASGKAAKPGDMVTIYATGLGDTAGHAATGAVVDAPDALTAPPVVTIGGVPVGGSDLLYAGLTPTAISGLYQMNVRIPANTPAGDLPITVRVGAFTSPAGTTIPIGQ